MFACQPASRALPTRWLMTDERMGDALWRALERLPRGGGVVFRHYGLDDATRRRVFARVRRIARRRGLVVIRAGTIRMPGEAGVHNGRGAGLRTCSVHSVAEARRARRLRAGLAFVSPVHATRSHPGTPVLGVRGARAIAAKLTMPAIALGGMDERRFRGLASVFHGWAGIDAWLH